MLLPTPLSLSPPLAPPQSTIRRIVLFDMDETLGIFSDFGAFMDILNTKLSSSSSSSATTTPIPVSIYDHFNELLDLYPELLRPRILDIMKFLARMKRAGKCANVMIYTNNTGPISWSNHIKDYFNTKAGYPVFDKVIGAFKRPNGEHVEVRRTSHDKTYDDFVRCSNMVGKFEVFFIDDREHPGMHAENVYVINVKPYTREISLREFSARFKRSALFKKLQLKPDYIAGIGHADSAARIYSDKEFEVDKLVGDTILEKLQDFFGGSRVSGSVGSNARSARRKRNRVPSKRNSHLNFTRKNLSSSSSSSSLLF
jgi:hypothetical protein